MELVFEHGGTSFRWDESKAAEIEVEGEFIRIISAWRASPAEEAFYDQ